jgi:hypothetical protein
MSINWTWSCNGLYPKAVHNILNGTIDITNAFTLGNIKCAWVTDIYQPSSTEETWAEVKTNIGLAGGNSDDYYEGFEQSGGSPDIASTFSYNTSVIAYSYAYGDAYSWGTAWLESDVASVFPGVNVPAIDPAAGGTYLRTLVFYISLESDYLLGTIMSDDSGAINITPNGSDITLSWLAPDTGNPGTPGLMFSFDVCNCYKSYP